MRFIKTLLVLVVCCVLVPSCSDNAASGIPKTQSDSTFKADKMELAGTEFQKGNFTTAIKIFDDVISENNPATIYPAAYNQAYCYFRLGDLAEVKKLLDFVLTIDKNHPEYGWFKYNSYFMLGRTATKENKFEDAINFYQTAANYNQTANVYNNLAFIEVKIKRYNAALEHINMAINYDPNSSDQYSTRALIYLRTNEIDKAKKNIETSIKLDSLNPYAFKNRARIYIELKKYKEACGDLNTAKNLKHSEYADVQDVAEVDSLILKYCR